MNNVIPDIQGIKTAIPWNNISTLSKLVRAIGYSRTSLDLGKLIKKSVYKANH